MLRLVNISNTRAQTHAHASVRSRARAHTHTHTHTHTQIAHARIDLKSERVFTHTHILARTHAHTQAERASDLRPPLVTLSRSRPSQFPACAARPIYMLNVSAWAVSFLHSELHTDRSHLSRKCALAILTCWTLVSVNQYRRLVILP